MPRRSREKPESTRSEKRVAPDSVFLRLPTARDRAEYVKLRDVSEAFLSPWEPYGPTGVPLEPDDVFERLLDSCDTDSSRRYLVCLHDTPTRKERSTIAGQVSLNQIFRGPFQNCILGYWIGAQFANQGIMRCALNIALREAFEGMRLHRCEANIVPENAPSLALVRSLGFRYEGLAVRYLQIAGKWRDHEHWAMTKEDWDARKAD